MKKKAAKKGGTTDDATPSAVSVYQIDAVPPGEPLEVELSSVRGNANQSGPASTTLVV